MELVATGPKLKIQWNAICKSSSEKVLTGKAAIVLKQQYS